MYALDRKLKRKMWLAQLTAARLQCSMYEKKLFFGKPCPLVMIEHLAASLELDELRQMFNESLIAYKERAVNEMENPAYAPIDVHNRLREVASNKF